MRTPKLASTVLGAVFLVLSACGHDDGETDRGGATQPPSGWREVRIEQAVLWSPEEWPVVDLTDAPGRSCRMFLEGPAIYLHTAEPPVACSPLPPDAELVAGVHARALDAEGDLGGAPPDPIRVVTFADLGVELRIVDGDQPTVVERIVESVRPADP